jgi:geranylgeranyl pyrophosphate synthase
MLGTLFADAWPPQLGEATRYPLFTGGKRVRPALCFAMHDAIAGEGEWSSSLIHVAASIELIHTYSLVHDDLPCLDDDDTRRGRPTVHKQFGDGAALLVGDTLLTEAFSLLSKQELPAEVLVYLIQDLSSAAGYRGMIGGQAADIGLGGEVADLDTLSRLHQLKTGALLAVSATMGARVAGATPEVLQSAKEYGETVGLAFQLADDVLDAEEDAGRDGPPSYVKFLGQAETLRRAHALADSAKTLATRFPNPDRLVALADFIVKRDH